MLQSIFWGSVLFGNEKNCEHIHRGHITVTPPVDHGSFWVFLLICIAVPFIVIGIPIIKIWWDIKKHPNKPVRRVAKK